MFERLDAPQNLLAVKLGSNVTADEIDSLYRDVEAALKIHPRLNYYVDATNWSFIGADAALQSLKQRVKHSDWLQKFDRVAILTDNFFLKGLISVGAMMLPDVELRVFPSSEASGAFEWAQNQVIAA